MKIGVLDSGIGGQCVLEALREALPEVELIYCADRAHLPYGTKGPDEICACVLAAAKSLEVDAILLACHTATACALDTLRQELSMPIFGMIEPTLREADSYPRVGLLATPLTLATGVYPSLAIARSCPLFVQLVEADLCDGPLAQGLARQLLADLPPLDALILGCTHYPFLRAAIQQAVGPEVTLIDGIASCVEEVARHCLAESPQPQPA